jgi:GNAT superfamily N-acetyltransferase
MAITETRASGLEALALASGLLQRIRLEWPEAGLWEAADLQWWWRTPRRSDDLDQLFWLDDGRPLAAALLTDWTRAWGLDPITLPDAPAQLRARVWSASLARIDELHLDPVETLVRDDDTESSGLLRAAGFVATEEHGGATWMDASARPPIPHLPEGFVLVDRDSSHDEPHPAAGRSGPATESRLHQVALYDPTLDLAIRAPTGVAAAYALFWFDPVTRVGLVEPMRTEAAWQRRGLARAILATGLDRLARKGATKLRVNFSSPPGRALYLGSGFELGATDTAYARARHG